MTTLRSSPYNLNFDSYVYAKIQARNEYDFSNLSPANSGMAQIQTQPSLVQNLVRGSATSETQIEVDWDSLTTHSQIGGSSIISYNLQWDVGTNGLFWVDLAGYTSTYTSTSFIVTYGVYPNT